MSEFNKELPKRSRCWKIVIVATTLIIIGVIVYFALGISRSNPLVGVWQQETEEQLELDIKSNGTMSMEVNENIGGQLADVELKMTYEIETDEKALTLYSSEETINEILDDLDGDFEEQDVRQFVNTFTTKWSYSIEQDILHLTKLDSGESISYQRD